jgi:hypothetical protein
VRDSLDRDDRPLLQAAPRRPCLWIAPGVIKPPRARTKHLAGRTSIDLPT